MITLAQAVLENSTDQRRLFQNTKSAVRHIREARLVWRVIEIMVIVAGGLALEKINEWIKEQVFALPGLDSTGRSTWAAIVVAMIWFVAAGIVIWFHDDVVNEWMMRKIDRRRRGELVSGMMDYLSHRMDLEYQLGLLEHHARVAAGLEAN
jgi:hypothetical protein